MRTKRIKVYSFNELSNEAKEIAIENYRNSITEYFWMDESLETIKKGLEFFDFKLLNNYSIDYSNANSSYTSIENTLNYSDEIEELSSVRLYKFLINNYSTHRNKFTNKLENTFFNQSDCIFTGYCVDNNFIAPINEFLRQPKNITFKELMEECVYECLKAMENDYDYQNSDEHIIEQLSEYEFLENGNVFNN